jgi:hypothetical protein
MDGQTAGWVWYVLVRDDSGHTYVIPQNRGYEWERMVDTMEEIPEWATRVGPIRFKRWEEI